MPEMLLREPGFTYSACGPFIKKEERIEKFKITGDTTYTYRNELNKACFQHDMVYGDFKDLTKRTATDKNLRDKAFNIAKSPKYDGYQRGLASMVYKFFIKKTKGSGLSYTNKSIPQNFISQSLENFKKEKCIQHLKTIFGVLIQQICN